MCDMCPSIGNLFEEENKPKLCDMCGKAGENGAFGRRFPRRPNLRTSLAARSP